MRVALQTDGDIHVFLLRLSTPPEPSERLGFRVIRGRRRRGELPLRGPGGAGG
jgi:hypothetical protein